MEFLFELLAEALLEISVDISTNKKISKFIRYPLIFIIVLFFALVIGGIFFLGIYFIKLNLFASIFLIIISIILMVLGILKFKKVYIEKRSKYER